MAQEELGSFADDSPDVEEARAVAGNELHHQERAVTTAGGEDSPQDSIELAVTQINYTIESSDGTELPVINIFGRTTEGDVEHVRVHGFQPYFYTPRDSVSETVLSDLDGVVRWEDSDSDGNPYESIRGERLLKILTNTPRDVGQIRDQFEHYEADILFPNRFLIDKDITSGIRVPRRRSDTGIIDVPHATVEAVEMTADLRICTMDIEVEDRHGFPEDGEEEIICLSSHDSFTDEYIAWLNTPDGTSMGVSTLDAYEFLSGDHAISVRTFPSEDAMLNGFIEYIEETDPDVLTGWNFSDFDAPYLLDRLERVNRQSSFDLDYNRLSRVNEVWRSDWQGPNIKGRIVFDLLYAYQRTQFTELDSYRLEAVAEQELGTGKERFTGNLGDLWESDPERLLEYNVRDVELCVQINEKQAIIPFWQEVASFVGCKLEDATTPGDAVDMYVLHKAHSQFVLPSKGQQDAEEFEGGAVFDPVTGVREMVTVLDLKSLYPMCMVTINASPETKVDDEYTGETYRAPNGQRFRKEPDGIIREMVEELLAEREDKKDRRDTYSPDSPDYHRFDRQQAAVKVIMNSLYGVSGWERFRLYDKENAGAVTATGREVIRFTETAANELGYDVMYGDSVSGDRPIVVRDPNGMVRITPIEELFELAEPLAREQIPLIADGGPAVTAIPFKDRAALSGWEALSVSKDGTPEWQPIKQVIRHQSEKPIVRLQHKFGESVTTEDHSYMVPGDDGLVEVPPGEVDEPFRVPGMPDVDPIDTIDVFEALQGYEREYEDGRSVGSERTITKTKRVHADEEYVWFGHDHHGDLDSIVKVKRFIEVGSDDFHALIRLLGTYVAEGSASTIETTDSRFGASISESDLDLLEQLRCDYERLFKNTRAKVVPSDSGPERTIHYRTVDGPSSVTYNDRTRKLQMMNELAALFFREFAGQTSRGKRIPSFVFHLSMEEQDRFINALVDGDGSRIFPRYSDVYAERNFDFETTSRELAAGLSILLTQRGQKHSLKYRDEKDSYTIRTCENYRSGRDPVLSRYEHDGYVYDLSVEKNENFVDGVGGIVLHNTDSVMLEFGGDFSKADAIERSFEIAAHINNRYDAFARETLGAETHRFQIEFEKLYRRFFQASKKKRYAGHIIWKEGKDVDDIDITGFEYKRSDIAPITKQVQRDVLEKIVYGERLGDIEAYVRDVVQDFREGEFEYDTVGIPGGIGKRLDDYDTNTAHVRGASYANAVIGTNFQRGSKPKRLYLERVHPVVFNRIERTDPTVIKNAYYREFKRDPDVICFEYTDQLPTEGFEVDWAVMLEKTLKGPIARIFEALDISWEKVVEGEEQHGLDQFM